MHLLLNSVQIYDFEGRKWDISKRIIFPNEGYFQKMGYHNLCPGCIRLISIRIKVRLPKNALLGGGGGGFLNVRKTTCLIKN